MKIGFDLGYGYCKLVYGPDFEQKVFPSVQARPQVFGEKGFSEYTLGIKGVKSYIGNAAFMSRSKLLFSAFEGDRINSQVFQDLFLAGIGSCFKYGGGGGVANVVTGLPISVYKQSKSEIEQLKGKYEFFLDGLPIVVDIQSIKVVPQPIGSYFKLLASYPEMQNESLLLIDIGFKTTDLLRIEKDRVLSTSTGLDLGMSDVARTVVSYVNSRVDGRTWTINEIDELLDNGFVCNGSRERVPDDVLQPVLEDIFKAIWSRAVESFPEYLTLDKVVFTGGSTVRFRPFIEQMPYESMAVCSDAQMANAIGYRQVLEWDL